MTQPIDLYFWPTPNGWKASIVLEELELPYQLHLINIGAGDQFKPDFLKISPNNRMPAIIDHDGPDGAPISIFESGAILQYLARKTGKLYGTTARDQISAESRHDQLAKSCRRSLSKGQFVIALRAVCLWRVQPDQSPTIACEPDSIAIDNVDC